MKDLVEYIAKQLVSTPDEVSVDETENNGEVNLVLKVDSTDMGIIIGKSGQTIKAIRKLLLVRAIFEGKRVNLSIFEPEQQPSEPPVTDQAA